jgi:hypothetical protein
MVVVVYRQIVMLGVSGKSSDIAKSFCGCGTARPRHVLLYYVINPHLSITIVESEVCRSRLSRAKPWQNMPFVNQIIRSVPVKDPQIYTVSKKGQDREFLLCHCGRANVITLVLERAHILQRREGEVYVHYVNTDKRLDEWVPEKSVKLAEEDAEASSSHAINGRKRKRGENTNQLANSSPIRYRSVEFALDDDDVEEIQGEVGMTEEDYDIQHHKQITAQRNFDKVNFGHWQIKTWYVACTILWSLAQQRAGISLHTL